MAGNQNDSPDAVRKSLFTKHDSTRDQIWKYCLDHSTKNHPVLEKIYEETRKALKSYVMLGAPEVLHMNTTYMKALGAKKVIDVGVFTGASSLTAALAIPDDGQVLACDVSEEYMARARSYWKEAGVQHKIKDVLAPASDTLQKLIDEPGQAGTWDFAFVDADKPGYPTYYKQLMVLLRKGGIAAFDNTLWSGAVLNQDDQEENTVCLRELNELVKKESDKNFSIQLNVGDGYTVVVKQ